MGNSLAHNVRVTGAGGTAEADRDVAIAEDAIAPTQTITNGARNPSTNRRETMGVGKIREGFWANSARAG